jgi:vacuolar-type H+-ATPase subunit H
MDDHVSLREHLEAVRAGDLALAEERDRRYAEVATAREEALRIKEKADEKALDLASEIQKYKDEKANELRSQIESERGGYATKGDLTAAMEKVEAQLAPLVSYVAAQGGRRDGITSSTGALVSIVAVVAAVAGVVLSLIARGG